MEKIIGFKMNLYGINEIASIFIMGVLAFYLGEFVFLAFSKVFIKPYWKNGSVNYAFDLTKSDFNLSKTSEYGLLGLAMLSFLSVTIFAAVNGTSLGQTSYESRYEASQGMGFLTLFFTAFLPYMIYRLYKVKNSKTPRTSIAKISFCFILYGVFIYVILNGYRQILMAQLLLVVIFALSLKLVSRKTFYIGIFVLFPVFLTALAFIRYLGEDGGVFSSPMEAAFYYVQGDLFPVDAILKTKVYLETHVAPGMSVFFEHFLRLVPRFLYPEKPEFLNNASGYYTNVIVGYERGVTLSPTLVSEGLLVSGYLGVFIILFCSAILCRVYDLVLFNTKSTLVFCVFLSFVYMGFFIVREGLQAGAYRIIVMLVFLCIAWLIREFLISNKKLY